MVIKLICAAALLALQPCVSYAKPYAAIEVGQTVGTEVDDHSQADDISYGLSIGNDFGWWRAELNATSIAAGISFDNVRALAYGATIYRDWSVSPRLDLFIGAGADYLVAHAVDGVVPIAEGDGVAYRLVAGVSYRITKHSSVFVSATGMRADLEFNPTEASYTEWNATFVRTGLRYSF